MNETLKQKLDEITTEINGILDKNNQVIWLQVLLPKTYLLKQIEAYAYTLINEEAHKRFLQSFVYDDENLANKPKEIKRSLHYLPFDEPYKYGEIKPYESISIIQDDYSLISDGVVVTEGDSLSDKFSKSECFDDFWPEWLEKIKYFASNSSTLWSYIEFPSRGSTKNKILSYYVVFENHIESENIKSKINKILQKFLIEYGFETYSSELKKTALQSSLSAVMSRNQSHNIGSHVLNNLSNPEKIKEFLYKKNEENGKAKPENNLKGGYVSLYTENGKQQEKRRYHLTNLKDEKLKKDTDLVSQCITQEDLYPENLIAHFNTYLKARMDFIGDVGTSVQASLMNTSNLFDEVFAFFEKNLILLREISGKEDEFKYGFNLCHICDKEDKKGPQVAMPNGLLGQQAFYIILENLIRNTAKHEIFPEDNEVCFTIEVDSDTKGIFQDFCEVTVYSDIKNVEICDLVKSRNASINKSVLDENNTVREGGWGTIEMKLAAAYLCGLNLLDIDDKTYHVNHTSEGKEIENFPILEAIAKNNNGNEYFGYRFYLNKPKLALVVFENIDDNSKIIQDLKLQAGIVIIHKNDKRLENEIFNHDFLVYVGEKFIDNKWVGGKNLPQRVLHFKALDNDFSFENKQLWEKYYKDTLDGEFEGELKKDIRYFKFGENTFSFDRHGNDFPNEKNIDTYIEPFGTSTLIGQYLNNKSFLRNSLILYKCIEAVATKVLIIDERAQSARKYTYQNDNGDEILFSEIFKKTNIIVPCIDDISLIKSELSSKKGYCNVKNFIINNINDVNYLVLHYGIIEVLNKNSPDSNFLNMITEEIKMKNDNEIKIVIVSGRGQTKDIPSKQYFINHSTFSYFIANQFGRSKLHLTQLLKSCRTKN